MPRPALRLLVAEADRLQLQLIDMLLAPAGFELTMVESGREALQHLQAATPDLALLALDLPDLPGDEICGKIRRVTRLSRTPVVLIAPQEGRFGLSDDARARARQVGADLVLPRPLGDKNLRERIRNLLDAREDTPPREALDTAIIEDALRELPEHDPAEAHASSARAGDAPVEPERGEAPATDDAAKSGRRGRGGPTHDVAPAGPAPSDGSAAVPAPDPGATDDATLQALRHELESLRLENRQLKRKLAEAKDALASNVDPEARRLVAELERRNRGLLEALEELKSDGRGGGLFGRRK